MASRSEIIKTILSIFSTIGIITISLVAPNMLLVLAEYDPKIRKYSSRQVNRSIKKLADKKFLYWKKVGNQSRLGLTEIGKEYSIFQEILNKPLQKPKKWDGLWRVVIFDVPEKRRLNREYFRTELRRLGFYKFQKSVWIHAYPCEKEVLILGKMFRIENCITIITTTNFREQNNLKRYFNVT